MQALDLDESSFLRVLSELVLQGPALQNAPAAGLVPREALAADIVCARLAPHVANGFVKIERLAAPGFEDRPSLVLTVEGTGQGTIGILGAHFDVVPADRTTEGWEHDPFALHVGSDGTLSARGVTDCLGHVALLTELVAELGKRGERPRRTLKIVMIANEEEAPRDEIGLDYVAAQGRLDDLRGGPVYWLDSADFGPTLGTGGLAMWELEARGVSGHSGMVHNAVNALELAMATTLALGEWFRREFPPHPDEGRWGFLTPSTLKATVIEAPNHKVTKIPASVLVRGDIRLTPFHDLSRAIDGALGFVRELDRQLASGCAPAGFPQSRTVDGRRGSLSLRPVGRSMEGIACHLDSLGQRALREAIAAVRGEESLRPFSMTGSLPLVRDLQRKGFDIQITGFGQSVSYHAPNEQAKLAHFRQGFAVLGRLLEAL
jgi:acetylornithine deacetylase/succinyl-diaminopimelate desuccinylase-like protein